MSDALDKLQHELQRAQHALAGAELRCARLEAQHQAAVDELGGRLGEIERVLQEWMAALDVVADPIFIHDKDFRILRCNRAYQRCAGIPFKQIIGLPYYDVFPKTQAPICHCQQAVAKEEETEVRVGEATYRSRAISVKDAQGTYLYAVHILEDITESHRIKHALQASEAQYRRLFEAAKDGILILNADTGKIEDANPFILNLLSYSLSDSIGKTLWEIGIFSDAEASKAAFKELQDKGYIRYEDLPLETKGGQRRDVEFLSNVYEVNERKVIQCNIRDITERLRAKGSLFEIEEKCRSIADAAQDAILMLDGEGKISFWNAAAEKIFGYTDKEAMGQELHELLAPKRFHDAIRKGFGRFQISGEGSVVGKTTELAALRKDGTEFPIELSLSSLKRDKSWNGIGIVRDISERKRAERVLQDEKDFSDAVIANLPDLFFLIDHQGSLLRWNKHLERLYGLSPEEMPGVNALSFVHEEDRSSAAQMLQNGFETGSASVEVRLNLTNGVRDYFVTGNRVASHHGMLAIGVDITEHKHAEKALHAANRALRTLSAGNLALVRAKREDELLGAVTRIIVDIGGYNMAVVSYAQDNLEQRIVRMASTGNDENDDFSKIHLSLADTVPNQLPIVQAIRSGTTQIYRDIANDPVFMPWRDAVLARGYQSNLALPLSDGSRTFGGLSIYSSDPNAFSEQEEVKLLKELASDLVYGIQSLRTRVAHEQQAAILRQSLEQSIQTIADTVEARDPYTAGHQRRVADLARAIAQELGLPEEQIQGLHLAATIHDLGKVHVPSEILSKPGKLSDIEFMLIKTHPQTGYDILKDVKFPWPIADIVLQHHEKLDGSGYPQGLKEGQILLEAKILSVADVVEAISSHRPYRPSLGIEAALEEIERHRGVLYDAKVVDACTKLFREAGYKLLP